MKKSVGSGKNQVLSIDSDRGWFHQYDPRRQVWFPKVLWSQHALRNIKKIAPNIIMSREAAAAVLNGNE